MNGNFAERVNNEKELVERFNKRDSSALRDTYNILCDELIRYASRLFVDTKTTQPEDVVHDVFISLWSSEAQIQTVGGIKGYLLTSIKNTFNNHITHNKYVNEYNDTTIRESSYDIDYVENRLLLDNNDLTSLLPERYANVIRLYLEGWKSGEIARKLGCEEHIVYNVKQRAIKMLKKRIDKIYSFFYTLFN